MKTGRFGCVALLTSSEPRHSGVQGSLLQAIHDELAAHDLHLMLARLPEESLLDEAVVPRLLREWMVDGVLIAYNAFVLPRAREMIQRHRSPDPLQRGSARARLSQGDGRSRLRAPGSRGRPGALRAREV